MEAKILELKSAKPRTDLQTAKVPKVPPQSAIDYVLLSDDDVEEEKVILIAVHAPLCGPLARLPVHYGITHYTTNAAFERAGGPE